MTDIASLGLAVDSSGVVRATGDLDKFTGAADDAQKATDRLRDAKGRFVGAGKAAAAANDNAASAAKRATVAYGNWHTAAIRMASVLGTIAGTLATAALFRYADAWSDMQSRVGAAVKDMEAAPALMQRMADIANASYSPLDQTVEVYSRNVAVLRDLGRGATEAADFTEALNHALVLTATRGERAASVQNALSKAMAVGRLQADGLETILANGGEVAQVLADKLGTTVSGLRNMASQGKITGDVIASALIDRLEDLRDRAAEMPATIGDAFTRIGTNLTAFIGQIDQALGASESLASALLSAADGINWLRDRTLALIANFGQVAEAAGIVGVALGIAFGPTILASVWALVAAVGTGVVTAFNALTAAMLANPMTAFATAVTIAVAAAYYFRDEIQKAIGVDVVGIAKTAANLVIGSFVAAYEDIRFVWGNFGNIMGAAVIGGVNIAIKALNSLAASAKVVMNDLIGAMNMIPGVNIGTFDVASDAIGQIDNPYAKRLESAVGERNAAVQAALARDYIGEIGEAFRASTPEAQNFANAVQAANDNLSQMGGGSGGGGGRAKAAVDAIKQVEDASESAKRSLGQGFGGIIKGLVDGALSWKDALIQAGQAALKYINQIMQASGGGGLFGGGFFGGFMGALLGFAKGGVFQDGAVTAFAKGGIVNKPTVFPFAKGIGLMGEAGPEAIMPLRRGPDGRLGVSAPRKAANDQPLRLEIVSRFDADGGFESAVERSSRPVAMQESAKAAGQVARAVPSMALGAMDAQRTRRTRTISPGGAI